jgi:hypothetical protein
VINLLTVDSNDFTNFVLSYQFLKKIIIKILVLQVFSNYYFLPILYYMDAHIINYHVGFRVYKEIKIKGTQSFFISIHNGLCILNVYV